MIEKNNLLEILSKETGKVIGEIPQEFKELAKHLNIENMKTQTLGEKRVRTTFNPSDDSYVQQIKEKGAKFLDFIYNAAPDPKWNDETFNEWIRLKELALTALEEATMWAVKAATI